MGEKRDNGKENKSDSGQSGLDKPKPHRYATLGNLIGRLRLRSVLTLSMVLVVVLAVGITGLLAFYNSQYAVNDLANLLQDEVSDRIVQHLDTYLETPHQINHLCLDSIRLGEISIHDRESLSRHFQELSYRYPSFQSIFFASQGDGNYTIVSSVGADGAANGSDRYYGYADISTNGSFEEYLMNRNGSVIKKTFDLDNYDPRTRDWYKAAVNVGGSKWTPIYMWLEGVVSLDAVAPFYSDEHELIGVQGSSMTLTGIGDFLKALKISPHGQAFIMEHSGLIVASSTISEPFQREGDKLFRFHATEVNNTVISSAGRHILDTWGEREILNRQQFFIDVEGSRYYIQVTPYQDTYGLDWLIVVAIPESDFMGNIYTNNQITILLFILFIIGGVIFCIYLANWITRPILSMNRSARALAHGDWPRWSELDRADEIGELSHSFKVMSDKLYDSFASLKSSEERYLSLFQSSADAIVLCDRFSLTRMNRAAEAMLGYTEPEVRDTDIRTLGPVGIGIGEMIKVSESSLEAGVQEQTISQMVNGEERYINIRLTQVITGDSFFFLVYIRDITDQRRAIIAVAEQEALRESYTHIQMILEHLPDPTFGVDDQGRVLFWNQAMEKMTGLRSEEIIGIGEYGYADAIHHEHRPILIDYALTGTVPPDEFYLDVESGDGVLRAGFRLESDGQMFYYSTIAARLYDRKGGFMGAIQSMRDITSHKIGEEALLMANKKVNLLSGITRHDILNKVMIAKSYITLLEMDELSEDQLSSTAAITRAMKEIEHFIAFAKTYQEIGLKVPVWQHVGDTMKRACASLDLNDVQFIQTETGYEILADPLFEKVCYNLIENALRHGTNLTLIEITTQETGDGLRISVQDNGGGVPDNLKETIFERGYGKNTGYGLFLTREILSLSQIAITERGTAGIGCRFDIDVPKGMFRRSSRV